MPDPAAPVEHTCRVCGRHAAFGVGVCLRRGIEGTWFCWDHLPAADRPGPWSPAR